MHPSYSRWYQHGYPIAVGSILGATLFFLLGRGVLPNGLWALLYLLLVGVVAAVCGVRPALVSAVLAFFAWDFFFLPPVHTLQVSDPRDWLSLTIFLVVGVTIGTLAGRMREREVLAKSRELEAAVLNRLSAHLVSFTSSQAMAQTVLDEVAHLTAAAKAAIFVPDATAELQCLQALPQKPGERVAALAQWAHRYKSAIGLPQSPEREDHHVIPRAISKPYQQVSGGTDRQELYLLLQSSTQLEGVLYIGERADKHPYTPDDAGLLLSIANLVAAFLERQRLQTAAYRSDALVEADRLKSTLISSVSHELKTPLAAVTATVTSMLEDDVEWDVPTMRQELRSIHGDLERLHGNISALLDFARLEADAWHPQCAWYEVGEVLGSALSAFPQSLQQRFLCTLPDDLPLLYVDCLQLARALQHILENALAYSPPEAPIRIGAARVGNYQRIWVDDSGPGIPQQERARVFEKFYRGSSAQQSPSGTGLGLAITAEIIRFHHGTIWVEDVRPRGSRFMITLPLTAQRQEQPDDDISEPDTHSGH